MCTSQTLFKKSSIAMSTSITIVLKTIQITKNTEGHNIDKRFNIKEYLNFKFYTGNQTL